MGYLFILFYIVFVGAATIFLKIQLDHGLHAYKLLAFGGLAMFFVGIISTWVIEKGLHFSKEDMIVGGIYGILHGIGTLGFFLAADRLPIGIASALAVIYVAIVVVVSWLFLGESLTWWKALGFGLLLAGAVVLALQKGH